MIRSDASIAGRLALLRATRQRWWRPSAATVGVAVATLVGSVLVGLLMSGIRGNDVRTPIVLFVALLLLPRWLLLVGAIVLLRPESLQLENLGYALPVSISEVILLAWLVRQSFAAAVGRKFHLSAPAGWLIAFLVWAWIATLLAGVTITPLMRLTVYALVAIVLAWDPPKREHVLGVVALYASVELLLSIPDLRSAKAGVTVGDPHELGMLLLAGGIAVLAGSRPLRRVPPLRWGLFAFLLGGALGTERRAVWFAAGVLLSMALAKRASPRRLLVMGLALGGVGILVFNPISDAFELGRQSADIRLESIVLGVDTIQQDPLLGIGWAGFDAEGLPSGDRTVPPFNLFVNVGASLGIPGLVLLIGHFVSVVRASARDHDRAGFLFVAGFLAISLTAMTLYAKSLMTFLYFVFAGLYSTMPARASGSQQSRQSMPQQIRFVQIRDESSTYRA